MRVAAVLGVRACLIKWGWVACLISGVPGGPEQPPGAFCWAHCSPRAGDPAQTGPPSGGKGAPCGVGPPGVAGSTGVAGTAGGSGVGIAAGSADSALVSLLCALWPSFLSRKN